MTDQPSSYVDAERLIAAFLSTKMATTQVSYGSSLRHFSQWCDDIGLHVLDVTTVDCERYFRALEKAGRAQTTISARQAALASFYEYAVAQGLRAVSPMSGIKRPPKVRKPDTEPLTREELGAIVTATELMNDLEASVVLLSALNGLKPNEILGAQASGLHRVGRFTALSLAGRQADGVAVLPPIVAERVLSAVGKRKTGPLLQELTDRFQIYRIVAKAGRRAHLSGSITPNILRVTMWAVALEAGCTPGTLAQATGLQDPRAFSHLMPASSDVTHHPAVRVANALINVPVAQDLLHQVRALLEDSSVHPVAPIVLLGAILESRLRLLVQQHGLSISGTPGLSRYVHTLKAGKAITQLEWHELQGWTELRNQAAHGRDLETLTDVMARKMETGVSDFLRNHP